MQILFRCILVLFLMFSACNFLTKPSLAVLRQHHDAPGILHYHSQVSIKDEYGHAWQVVLYKLFSPGKPEEINLRLVGFPGIIEFKHPQTLEIITANNQLFRASDFYSQQSPAANVGEYKFTDILSKLPTTDALKLYLPTQTEEPLLLKIPQTVVTEWQWLVTEVR